MDSDELAWRAHFVPGMWVVLVVILEPPVDLRQHRRRVGRRVDAKIVALESPHKRNRPLKAALFVPVVICHDDLNRRR